MSIQDTLGALANNLRSASGYQNRLSLSDMGSMATGLTTYNLLPNTTNDLKEVTVFDGQWSVILYSDIKLPAGLYTFSIFVDLTDYSNNVSNRIEWRTMGRGNGPINKVTDLNASWGTLTNTWLTAGNKSVLSTSFKLAVDDTIKLGISGNPLTKGVIKYSSLMLNVGTFIMPYTPNTLVRGGGINYLFPMLSLFRLFERVVI